MRDPKSLGRIKEGGALWTKYESGNKHAEKTTTKRKEIMMGTGASVFYYLAELDVQLKSGT